MHFDRPSVRALTGNYGNPWTDVGVSVDPDSMLRVGGESGCFQQAGTWMCWGDGHNGAVGVEDPADQIGPRPLCE